MVSLPQAQLRGGALPGGGGDLVVDGGAREGGGQRDEAPEKRLVVLVAAERGAAVAVQRPKQVHREDAKNEQQQEHGPHHVRHRGQGLHEGADQGLERVHRLEHFEEAEGGEVGEDFGHLGGPEGVEHGDHHDGRVEDAPPGGEVLPRGEGDHHQHHLQHEDAHEHPVPVLLQVPPDVALVCVPRGQQRRVPGDARHDEVGEVPVPHHLAHGGLPLGLREILLGDVKDGLGVLLLRVVLFQLRLFVEVVRPDAQPQHHLRVRQLPLHSNLVHRVVVLVHHHRDQHVHPNPHGEDDEGDGEDGVEGVVVHDWLVAHAVDVHGGPHHLRPLVAGGHHEHRQHGAADVVKVVHARLPQPLHHHPVRRCVALPPAHALVARGDARVGAEAELPHEERHAHEREGEVHHGADHDQQQHPRDGRHERLHDDLHAALLAGGEDGADDAHHAEDTHLGEGGARAQHLWQAHHHQEEVQRVVDV
mmetsp:Transcript_35362/g.77239  ORF Transcript_35362/g.77239 Transcript_35362/m.77239 type:complete len:475 (+) Transcript_35362:1170-2594(+)